MKSMQFHQLARRIITYQHSTERTSHEIAASAVQRYKTLLTCLSAILGDAGGVALLRRSLRLAEATSPCYSIVRNAAPETLLSAVGTCLQTQEAERAFDASVELLSIHIELVATFIGQRLTKQLLQEAWPELPASILEEPHA